MPADADPQTSCPHNLRMVHFQCFHGGPATRGKADDLGAVFAPLKMIGPLLAARVEDQHALMGKRIARAGLIAFVGIAGRAGAAKVGTAGRAALRARTDMIDLQRDAGYPF